MLTQEQRDYAARRTLTLQIIVGVLLAGPLVFLIFTLLTHDASAVDPDKSLLSTLGILFAAACSAAALIVPRIVMTQARKAIAEGTWQPNQQAPPPPEEIGDVGALTAAYQTKTIIACALLEGATFLNTIAYNIEGRWTNVAVVVALLLGIAICFPPRSRMLSWLERELNQMKQLRQFES